ncbi:DUF6919 domain-containing protein [Streptomyces sp. NPDC101249]|uniref:DUF6919 domain-containing protein n=1 Tax=Streptomyces sp. NPDC101249 TaxID=3366140 RepID=UPI00380CD7FA
MLPVLARANQGGFLTDSSQPGCDEPGADGRRWRQRAAVEGFVTDERLLFALDRAAQSHRLTFLSRAAGGSSRRPAVTVTAVDGKPYTWFGAQLTARDLRHIWQGLSRPAMDAVIAAQQVTIIDPTWGSSTRLWTALDEALTRTPTY